MRGGTFPAGRPAPRSAGSPAEGSSASGSSGAVSSVVCCSARSTSGAGTSAISSTVATPSLATSSVATPSCGDPLCGGLLEVELDHDLDRGVLRPALGYGAVSDGRSPAYRLDFMAAACAAAAICAGVGPRGAAAAGGSGVRVRPRVRPFDPRPAHRAGAVVAVVVTVGALVDRVGVDDDAAPVAVLAGLGEDLDEAASRPACGSSGPGRAR